MGEADVTASAVVSDTGASVRVREVVRTSLTKCVSVFFRGGSPIGKLPFFNLFIYLPEGGDEDYYEACSRSRIAPRSLGLPPAQIIPKVRI